MLPPLPTLLNGVQIIEDKLSYTIVFMLRLDRVNHLQYNYSCCGYVVKKSQEKGLWIIENEPSTMYFRFYCSGMFRQLFYDQRY